MFGFFKRQKQQPPENQLLLTELEKFRIRYRGQGLYDDIAVDTAVQEISKTFRTDASYATRLIAQGGWSVPDAASLIISEFASDGIRTGELHIYRGVMNDQGKAYLKLFQVCIAKLLSSGKLTEKEAVEQVRELEDEIRAIG